MSSDDHMERAARWLARSQDKSFSDADQQDLAAWLAEDPTNRQAFEEMNELWRQVGALEPAFADELDTTEMPQVAKDFDTETKSDHKNRFFHFFETRKKMSLAAVMAMLVLLCLPVLNLTFFEQRGKVYVYSTATGEQKTITLNDGSVLSINVSSAFTVQMGKSSRRVVLNEGEVFFNVKPDPKRPFEVRTSKGLVRVLGTAFNVKNRKGVMAVDVDHGKVQVRDVPKAAGDRRVRALTLLSGQGADIDAGGHLAPIRTSCMEQVLAWRDHRVVFKKTPVSNVLQELALYHNADIKLAFDALGQKRVTGTFDMQNLEQTLRIIATAASLQIKKDTNGTITLSGRPVVKTRL